MKGYVITNIHHQLVDRIIYMDKAKARISAYKIQKNFDSDFIDLASGGLMIVEMDVKIGQPELSELEEVLDL